MRGTTETSVKRRALLRPGTAKGATRTVRSEVRWDEYAEAYDVMCSANPAYAENLDIFRAWIDSLSRSPPNAKVCDVGARTETTSWRLPHDFHNRASFISTATP